MTSQVSAFSTQHAHFTFSTQGIVQRIRMPEAAKPAPSQHFFMSAHPKPLETPNLSLARLSETLSCKYSCKDALKNYGPQKM